MIPNIRLYIPALKDYSSPAAFLTEYFSGTQDIDDRRQVLVTLLQVKNTNRSNGSHAVKERAFLTRKRYFNAEPFKFNGHVRQSQST